MYKIKGVIKMFKRLRNNKGFMGELLGIMIVFVAICVIGDKAHDKVRKAHQDVGEVEEYPLSQDMPDHTPNPLGR